MAETQHDPLWRGFPKTLLEFEERFGMEAACREYLAACRLTQQHMKLEKLILIEAR